MFKLSNELREYKTLITTTTKIFPPQKGCYDYFYLGLPVRQQGLCVKKGITLAARDITPDGKLLGYEPDMLNGMVSSYDCAVIESDGAKLKYLKGWNDEEPVVISSTTKTVGIINLRLLGAEITTESIHRPDIYIKNFCKLTDRSVDLDQLQSLICSPQGLFKNAVGKRILFVNMIESPADKEAMNRLGELLAKSSPGFPDKIVYGSLLEEEYGIWEGTNEK